MDDILFLGKIKKIIYDKKGKDILILDLKNISCICDYMILAEGNIERHTRSIVQEIVSKLKKEKIYPLKVEGEGDWTVIDYGFVIVHVFIPELRKKYQIEKIWSKGKIVKI